MTFDRIQTLKYSVCAVVKQVVLLYNIYVKTHSSIYFVKEKESTWAKATAKIPFQIFLWLDNYVMSAWLQSKRLFQLGNCSISTWILKSTEIQLVEKLYFLA